MEMYYSGMPPLFDTPGLHHIGLRCGDLARARHFYGTVLGFPILRAEPTAWIIWRSPAATRPNSSGRPRP
jgi:catechol-2,3-dioxygenase